jgi:alpha-amylase
VLTRRRESYHLPPSDRPGHAEATHATDGAPSIHDLEAAARLERMPPIDPSDRALLVDRVLGADVTLDRYTGGAFDSVACWAGTAFHASVEQSAQAVEVVLHPGPSPAGLFEKRIKLDQAGELTVRYRWDPAAFPPDAFFCPEISVSPEVALDLKPAADVWKFPIATVSRSERGFEETVQGYSYTPRWPIRVGEARLTVRVRPSV